MKVTIKDPATGKQVMRRVCDNEQCQVPLTETLSNMQGKFGQSKRIIRGVTTLSVVVRTDNGKNVHITGEWCHACADAGMAVLLDKVQEERSLLGAGTKKVD